MNHINKLLTLTIVIFLLPFAALAERDLEQLQLMKDAYTKTQNLKKDMEYLNIVESSCSSLMGSTPYKDWFIDNLGKLSAMTKIQKAWKEKAVAYGGQQVTDHFNNEEDKLKQELDFANKMLESASLEKKSRLCDKMYSDDSIVVMESNLSFLVVNEEDIYKAINNDDNW